MYKSFCEDEPDVRLTFFKCQDTRVKPFRSFRSFCYRIWQEDKRIGRKICPFELSIDFDVSRYSNRFYNYVLRYKDALIRLSDTIDKARIIEKDPTWRDQSYNAESCIRLDAPTAMQCRRMQLQTNRPLRESNLYMLRFFLINKYIGNLKRGYDIIIVHTQTYTLLALDDLFNNIPVRRVIYIYLSCFTFVYTEFSDIILRRKFFSL